MSEKIRCFVALDLPEEIRRQSKDLQDALKSGKFLDARYTEDRNLHLTLKFLGEIDEVLVEKVRERLRKVSFNPFKVHVTRAGTFSQEDEIKIIWHALGGEGLTKIQNAVDDALNDMFPPEKRFMAHITVARVKKVQKKKELNALLDSAIPDGKEYVLDRFSLKKSILTPEGSTYETIEVYSAQNFK